MGLTDKEADEQKRKLKPTVDEKPERGHGRGKGGVDRSTPNAAMRGIPLVGVGGGAIPGTRPGDSAEHLHDEGLKIVRRYRKRKQAEQKDQD